MNTYKHVKLGNQLNIQPHGQLHGQLRNQTNIQLDEGRDDHIYSQLRAPLYIQCRNYLCRQILIHLEK